MADVESVAKLLGVEIPQDAKICAAGYFMPRWHGIDVAVLVYPTGAKESSGGANPAYLNWLNDEEGYSAEVLSSPFPIDKWMHLRWMELLLNFSR